MYGADPNVIADNSTPLDVAIAIKAETISEQLINYGGQTVSQLQRKKEYKLSEFQSSSPTLSKETTTKSLLTTDHVKMYEEELSYTLKRNSKEKILETQNFTSLKGLFT